MKSSFSLVLLAAAIPPQATETTTLIIGQSGQLQVNDRPVGSDKPTYHSSDPAVAVVSASGQVSAITAGTATIVARTGAHEASVEITVEKSEAQLKIEREAPVTPHTPVRDPFDRGATRESTTEFELERARDIARQKGEPFGPGETAVERDARLERERAAR